MFAPFIEELTVHEEIKIVEPSQQPVQPVQFVQLIQNQQPIRPDESLASNSPEKERFDDQMKEMREEMRLMNAK